MKLNFNITMDQIKVLSLFKYLPLQEFINLTRKYFTIDKICQMCGIDRNRYNYLVRSKEIDVLFMCLKQHIGGYNHE